MSASKPNAKVSLQHNGGRPCHHHLLNLSLVPGQSLDQTDGLPPQLSGNGSSSAGNGGRGPEMDTPRCTVDQEAAPAPYLATSKGVCALVQLDGTGGVSSSEEDSEENDDSTDVSHVSCATRWCDGVPMWCDGVPMWYVSLFFLYLHTLQEEVEEAGVRKGGGGGSGREGKKGAVVMELPTLLFVFCPLPNHRQKMTL